MLCCCYDRIQPRYPYLPYHFFRLLPLPFTIIGITLVASSFGTKAERSIGAIDIYFLAISGISLVETVLMSFHPLCRQSTTCNPWHRFVIAAGLAIGSIAMLFRTIYLDWYITPRCKMIKAGRSSRVDPDQDDCQIYEFKIISAAFCFVSAIAYFITGFGCTMTMSEDQLASVQRCRRCQGGHRGKSKRVMIRNANQINEHS